MPSPSRYRLPSPHVSLPELARIVSDMRVGRLDVGGEVKLLAGTTETVVQGNTIGVDTIPILVPVNASGATIDWWVEDRGKGELTLGHTAPLSDKDFLILLFG